MADQPRQSSAVDLEKDEEAPSVHSSTTDHEENEPHYASVAERSADIEAIPTDDVEAGEKSGVKRALTHTLSRFSTKSSWKDPGPPPDGGLQAWVQCAMGFVVIMNTW